MSLLELRVRIQALTLRENIADIERERVEAMMELDAKRVDLEQAVEKLRQKQVKWDEMMTRTAKSKRPKGERPGDMSAEIQKIQATINRLSRELGELGEGPYQERNRPAESKVTYPEGAPKEFQYHTWLPLPDAPAGAAEDQQVAEAVENEEEESERSKGPGEDEFRAMTGGTRPEGGRFDVALPGGKSAELKLPRKGVFRGGASARVQAAQVRRRLERIINQVADLLPLADGLSPEQARLLTDAHHLLSDVDTTLLKGGFQKADAHDTYSALEKLRGIKDLKGGPGMKLDEAIFNDPAQFFNWINEVMRTDKCFKTDYIVLIRGPKGKREYLVIPQQDYNARIKFVFMSKGDAYFRYV